MKIINVALPTSTQFGTFQVEGMESTFLGLKFLVLKSTSTLEVLGLFR